MSVFILPYQALGVELTDDHAERSSLMTWRWLAGQCGAVVALALGFGHFFAGEGGLTARENYAPFASVLGLILTSVGRASWMERVCSVVVILVVVGYLKNQQIHKMTHN